MSDFVRLFAYDRWANEVVLRTLSQLQDPPQRAVKVMAHIVGTQYVWYARMMGEAASVPVWPEWSAAQIGAPAAEIAARWKEAAMRGEDFLRREFSYSNTKGEKWTSRNDDVLMHVVMHGAYHRGQIAAQIRASGNEPPYTDYIQAVRAGLLI